MAPKGKIALATFLSIVLAFMVAGMIAVIVIAVDQRKVCGPVLAIAAPITVAPIVTAAPATVAATVAPTAAPTTAAPTRAPFWNPYKTKLSTDTPNQWSYKIYNAITGGAAVNENPNGGGVNDSVVKCGLRLRPNLTQTEADCLCKSPCAWYGNTAAGQIATAGLCNCTTLKATIFL